jgi:hypothetical protein
MWTRKELKLKAKEVLKKNYWKAFLVSIVIAVAGGGNFSVSCQGDDNYEFKKILASSGIFENPVSCVLIIFIIVMVIIIMIMLIAAFRIFLGYPLEVGGRSYFIKLAQNHDHRKCFGDTFNKHNYLGIVRTMLRTGIQLFLWSLLLIIPGIIKAYAYRMIPYILADNPNIGAKKAIGLSNQMTNGHKFKIFVLDLSFIGWYLLGMLALILGILFVLPYQNATEAELYLVLRKNALDNRMCDYEDLLLNSGE